MNRFVLLAFVAFFAACSSGADHPIDPPASESCVDSCGGVAPSGCSCEGGCEGEACCADFQEACGGDECAPLEAPEGCPESRVAETIDFETGCRILVCSACPQVDIPACDDGTLRAVMDEATDCPTAWSCETCQTPTAPTCTNGYPEAITNPLNGCIEDWECIACPAIEPASCEGATATRDLATGCVVLWNCPHCPEPEIPVCKTGEPILEQDPSSGCSDWVCPACPEPERTVCDYGEAELVEDDETGCEEWVCPWCPEIPPPACQGVIAITDPETGCPGWECPECPVVDRPSCQGAIEQTDPVSGCTTGWQCPGDYWESVETLTGAAFEGALRNLIEGHNVLGYDRARDKMFNEIDVLNGVIECIYTGRTTPPNGSRTPGGFNTEHSWPQSQGARSGPANSDIHHLFPTHATPNSRRSSHDFGETACTGSACTWAEGGSELGTSVHGGSTVFQVRTAYRGDIARAHFYFAVRYNMDIPATEEATLREWHLQDPVSQVERDRNDAIESHQRNRNPFVDRPDFVSRITNF